MPDLIEQMSTFNNTITLMRYGLLQVWNFFNVSD